VPLPADFARTGFFATQATGVAPKRFQVLGERSSGTNFVKRLLGRNSPLKPSEELGWKHGFAQMMAIPPDLAVICVVRAPEAWALSMYAKPWHTKPGMQALAFSEFIRAPWDTIIDRPRYFGAAEAGAVGQPLQQDRDPLTGAVFDNLFALRRAKLTALLSYLNRECPCIVLRTEVAQETPEATLDNMRAALSLPARNAPFRPVVKRLGSKFKPSITHSDEGPAQMNEKDRAFMRVQLDPAQETALGYAI